MDILKKFKIPKKDIRVVKLPLDIVRKNILGIIKQSGWFVVKEDNQESSFFITATNPTISLFKLFLNREPQVVHWCVSNENEYSNIEVFFDLFRNFRFVFYSILFLLLIGCYIGILGIKYFVAGPPDILKALIFFSILIISCFSTAFFLHWLDGRKYMKFLSDFYNKLHDDSGMAEIVRYRGGTFPERINSFIFILAILSPMFLMFFVDIDMLFPLNFLSMILFFLGLVAIVIMSMLVLQMFRPSIGSEANFSEENLMAGLFFTFYCSFPLVVNVIPLQSLLRKLESNQLSSNQIIFLLFACLVFIPFFSMLMCFLIDNCLTDLLEELKNRYSHNKRIPGHDNSGKFGDNFVKSIHTKAYIGLVLTLWLIISFVTIFGIYFSLSGIEHVIFGKNYFFKNIFVIPVTERIDFGINLLNSVFRRNFFSSNFSKIILFLYTLPIIGVIAILIFKKIKETISLYKNKNFIPEIVIQKIRLIAESYGIRTPKILVINSPFVFSNIRWTIPFRNIFVITNKTVEFLNRQELEALLAHEMGHIKKHAHIYTFLNFFSEWTLFGKGFLTAVLDSRQTEYDADDFCLKWLNERGMSKRVLIDLLNKTLTINSAFRYVAQSTSLLAFNEAEIFHDRVDYENLGFKKKLKLLYEFYFGDLILSYVHPTIEERIRRIEALA